MKPKVELIEAILLVYIKSEIKNVIILHEGHAKTDFESSKEYTVFNKTLKEKDILKYIPAGNMTETISQSLGEFDWDEIRFIFLQYLLEDGSTLKLKLRPASSGEPGNEALWHVYGKRIHFFSFSPGTKKEDFIRNFEIQLIEFLS